MVLRIKTVRKCGVNLQGECFCPDLSEMNLSCLVFSDAGLERWNDERSTWPVAVQSFETSMNG